MSHHCCCCVSASCSSEKRKRMNDIARLVHISREVEQEYINKHLHPDKEVRMSKEELFKFSENIRATRELADQVYPGAREFWPAWDPSIFNDKKAVKVNNCMDYAFLFYATNEERSRKNQPGERSNLKVISKDDYSCSLFKSYLLKDFPGIRFSDEFIVPRPGFYLSCLMLSQQGKNSDYHFLVMLKNGQWGHKPGSSRVTLVDADGKYIWDPRRANLSYPHWKYKTFCCFIEIPIINDSIRLETFEKMEKVSNHLFDSMIDLDYRQDLSLNYDDDH